MLSSGLNTLTFVEGSNTLTRNPEHTEYQLEEDLTLQSNLMSAPLQVKTTDSLKGELRNGVLMPPKQGIIRMTAPDGTYVELDANDGDNNAETFQLTIFNGSSTTSQAGIMWSGL